MSLWTVVKVSDAGFYTRVDDGIQCEGTARALADTLNRMETGSSRYEVLNEEEAFEVEAEMNGYYDRHMI